MFCDVALKDLRARLCFPAQIIIFMYYITSALSPIKLELVKMLGAEVLERFRYSKFFQSIRSECMRLKFFIRCRPIMIANNDDTIAELTLTFISRDLNDTIFARFENIFLYTRITMKKYEY